MPGLSVVSEDGHFGGWRRLKFGIESMPPSSERLAELLRSCGLSLIEQHTLGQEMAGKRALGGFAVATVK